MHVLLYRIKVHISWNCTRMFGSMHYSMTIAICIMSLTSMRLFSRDLRVNRNLLHFIILVVELAGSLRS